MAALLALATLPARAKTATDREISSRITFAMGWEPVTFYPLRALDSASYYAQSLVYQGLVKYDRQLNVVPALAERFDVSADGLAYTFVLRAGTKFADGEPVTMADVVQSIRWAKAPTSPYQADYADISGIESRDGKTLTLRLLRPCGPFLSRMVELRVMPARLLSRPDHGRDELSRRPVGAGPFRLARWESGLELVFEPNPFYWGKRPACDRLVWRIVPDSSLRALALKNGEIDVAQCEAGDWSCFLGKHAGQKLTLARFPGARTIFVGFNLKMPLFKNVALRQAVEMAMDRKGMIDHLFAGCASPATSDFASHGWAYNRRAVLWPYSPAAARGKLAQAGFKSCGSWWLTGAGQPLGFSILTVHEYEAMAETVASCLRRIGIRTEVQLVEFSTLRQRYLKSGQFQAVVWSRSVGPDPECLISWHSKGPLNWCGYANPRLDEVLERGRRAMDRPTRIALYAQAQDILSRDLPWAYLVQPDLLIAHSRSIINVQEPGQERTGLPWDNPLFNAPDWQTR